MADSAGNNLTLHIKGERWVSYPRGMRFPRSFAENYPFRGRGIVSRLLYWFHSAGLDKLVLNVGERPPIASRFGFEIAFFWPSKVRSSTRFYGYGVKDGKVVEYIKFATGESERSTLEREAENTMRACKITKHLFMVPEVLGCEEDSDCFAVRYQPLPEDAKVCPLTDDWVARVRDARRQIASAGYMHGDFAWHNFRASGGKLWILDWEEMKELGNPLVDEICLECGLAYYWRHTPIGKVIAAFHASYGGDASLSAKARAAVEDLARRKITMGDVLDKVLGEEGWK